MIYYENHEIVISTLHLGKKHYINSRREEASYVTIKINQANCIGNIFSTNRLLKHVINKEMDVVLLSWRVLYRQKASFDRLEKYLDQRNKTQEENRESYTTKSFTNCNQV